MAINFVTGLPRSGKTLFTLVRVKKEAEENKRPVFYCNIPGITLEGWTEIASPDDWMNCPDNSIIIVDELQDFWQKQPVGAKVPAPILELSKHGKRGIDFYFITQEPDLVHTTPRSLCQFHFYVNRVFGMERSVIRQFQRMQLHPERIRSCLEEFFFEYPKKAYTWYKSADTHNVKVKLPFKAKLFPFLLVFVLCFVGYVFWGLSHGTFVSFKGKKVPDAAASAGVVSVQSGAVGGAPGSSPPPHKLSPAEYVADFVPRVEGLQHTAPRYDDLTKPVRVPLPAACMYSESKPCHCYTQDGTSYTIDQKMCRQIADKGIFLDFQPAPQSMAAASASAPASSVAPGTPAPAVPAAPMASGSSSMQEWNVGLNAPAPAARHSIASR